MTGDINMGSHYIIHSNLPSSSHHTANVKYVKSWSYPNSIANLYLLQMDDQGLFDVRDDTSNIVYAGNSEKTSQLLNLGRKENWNLVQNNSNKKPLSNPQ